MVRAATAVRAANGVPTLSSTASMNRVHVTGEHVPYILGASQCMGSQCAMWRWKWRWNQERTHGYCGLAGRPEVML